MNKVKIVMIDDNEDILFTVAEICKTRGYEVCCCENYHIAEPYFARGDIDLYLVDYHLPEKDGVDVVRMIRSVNKSVPIMMLTVESSENVVQQVKEAGANDYALKPVRAVDFLSRLELHLKQGEQNRFYNDRTVGINQLTLDKITRAMESLNMFTDAEGIAAASDIGTKSIYRYLKYMEEKELLDIQYQYEKQGRPKAQYKLKK